MTQTLELTDACYKTATINIFEDLKNQVDISKQMMTLSREMENYKKYPNGNSRAEKYTKPEIKYSLNKFNIKLEMARGRVISMNTQKLSNQKKKREITCKTCTEPQLYREQLQQYNVYFKSKKRRKYTYIQVF